MKSMLDYWVKPLATNKGSPRIYLDSAQAVRAGFSPGQKVRVKFGDDMVILSVNDDGSRVIEHDSPDVRTYTVSSRRRKEKVLPVLDIQHKDLDRAFAGMEAVRIIVKEGKVYLLPLASEIQKRERLERALLKLTSGQSLDAGSLAHGGGVLAAAIHEGLKKGGINTNLLFANEIRADLVEHARNVHPNWNENTLGIAAPMQEIVQDDFLMANLPLIDILELGIPCSGASKSGASKLKLSMMEEHPHVGHLVYAAIAIINRCQPLILCLENVVEYAKTASAQILRQQLRDMGYDTHEAILSGKDFGCLENRVRWTLVAVTRGMSFSFEQIEPAVTVQRKLGDILEDISDDDPRWSLMEGLRRKEERDKENGKGFMMQIYGPDDDHINTITKGYAKVRSTDPKIRQTTNPMLLRQLTANEHAAVKGVNPAILEGLSETVKHELLGQGIAYDPFVAAGVRMAESIMALVEKRGIKEYLQREEDGFRKTSRLERIINHFSHHGVGDGGSLLAMGKGSYYAGCALMNDEIRTAIDAMSMLNKMSTLGRNYINQELNQIVYLMMREALPGVSSPVEKETQETIRTFKKAYLKVKTGEYEELFSGVGFPIAMQEDMPQPWKEVQQYWENGASEEAVFGALKELAVTTNWTFAQSMLNAVGADFYDLIGDLAVKGLELRPYVSNGLALDYALPLEGMIAVAYGEMVAESWLGMRDSPDDLESMALVIDQHIERLHASPRRANTFQAAALATSSEATAQLPVQDKKAPEPDQSTPIFGETLDLF